MRIIYGAPGGSLTLVKEVEKAYASVNGELVIDGIKFTLLPNRVGSPVKALETLYKDGLLDLRGAFYGNNEVIEK